MSKLFFHLMPDAEWQRRKKAGQTWGDIMLGYQQPTWCAYPKALNGVMGCWSLVGRMVTGEAYCEGCDYHRANRRRESAAARRRKVK